LIILLPRLVVLTWLIVWVLTIPLFHIHALDTVEDRVGSQAFLPHTVVSPDLAGEYVAPTAGHTLSSHLPRYSELAIAAYSEDDSKRKHGVQPSLLLHVASLKPVPLTHLRAPIPEAALPPMVRLPSASPRAPPVLS